MVHRFALPATVLLLGSVLHAQQTASTPAATNKVEQVIIVFKTHFDIGYTDLAVNIVQKYRTTMIDQALKVVDQNRSLPGEQQFVWTVPGWPMKKILEDWPGQTPQRKQQVMQAFYDGRFAVHALPFTMQTEMSELETLVRGLSIAAQLTRDANLPPPRGAKMTDVPCHSWILPTLLTHAGVNFLHIGCNSGSSSPQVPELFWWQGPDGSKLLTMYTATGYGTGLIPPANWPHKTWLALCMTGDNHGPPTPAEVKKMLDQARDKMPGVKVLIGQLSDFSDAILAEKPELPVVHADMPDTWIHGVMCDPEGVKLARTAAPNAFAAEALNTLLGIWGAKSPCTPAELSSAVNDAYEQLLLYFEHTWGGALYWVTRYGSGAKWNYGEAWKADLAAGKFKKLQESWDEHTRYAQKAEAIVAPILNAELQALAQACDANGQRVVVFNPLPWKRDGLAISTMTGADIYALRPADGGQAVEVHSAGKTIQFLAHDVPSMGYRVYVPAKLSEVKPAQDYLQATIARAASAPTTTEAAVPLENRFLKLAIDPTSGVIRSLVDKRTGRELTDPSGGHAMGQYLYERFDANQVADYVKAYVKIKASWAINELGKPQMPPASAMPYLAVSPTNGKLEIEPGATCTTATVKFESSDRLPQEVTTRYILYHDAPFLDIELTITKSPDPWPEAGWLCLPFKVAAPQFRIGRQGSVVDPTKDFVAGSNRNLFAVSTGVAMFDANGQGAAFCPIDSPLVSLETPGCWKYSRDFVPAKPVAYVNLFNNQWTTNYRLWNAGTWSSRVRVWAVERYDNESGLVTPSLEARHPLLAACGDGGPGQLPASQSGLTLSRKGLMITALAANQNGDGLLLRIWELAGISGSLTITLPPKIKYLTAENINFRGENRALDTPFSGSNFSFDAAAFGPASYIVK